MLFLLHCYLVKAGHKMPNQTAFMNQLHYTFFQPFKQLDQSMIYHWFSFSEKSMLDAATMLGRQTASRNPNFSSIKLFIFWLGGQRSRRTISAAAICCSWIVLLRSNSLQQQHQNGHTLSLTSNFISTDMHTTSIKQNNKTL